MGGGGATLDQRTKNSFPFSGGGGVVKSFRSFKGQDKEKKKENKLIHTCKKGRGGGRQRLNEYNFV